MNIVKVNCTTLIATSKIEAHKSRLILPILNCREAWVFPGFPNGKLIVIPTKGWESELTMNLKLAKLSIKMILQFHDN